VSRKYKGKILWKWGIGLYIAGFAMTVASIASFVSKVSDDQICQTVMTFGFDLWRPVTVLSSVFFTPFVLIIEVIFNRIPVKLQHILFPVGFFFAYVGLSALISSTMHEPVYGIHLMYSSFNPADPKNNMQRSFDWKEKYVLN
jgi:hypothetical protein